MDKNGSERILKSPLPPRLTGHGGKCSLAAAALAALEAGIHASLIFAKGLEDFSSGKRPHGNPKAAGQRDIKLINDTYNANPELHDPGRI